MNGKSMADGAPWKHILRFALPVLAGSLLQQLYNTVDTIVVGRFSGEAALSAVGTTGSFAFLFLALAAGFSAGNGVVVAQRYGAGNQEQVRANASTGILLLLRMSVLATIAGLLAARPAYTHLVAVEEGFLELTLQYFRVYTLGLFFQFGYNIFSAILRAVGDSAATLYFLLIPSVSNIILDLLFVAGFKWGVGGAALATDIAQAGSFAAAYIYLINIILSLYIPLFGVFQGSNHGGAATVVAVGALGMRVLTTYLFRYSAFFGHTIIWRNGLFGFGTGFLIAWAYYLSGHWQNKSAIQNQIIDRESF